MSTVAGASGLVIAATFVLGATLCSLVAVLVALGGTLGAVLTFLAFFTVISCMVTLAAAGSMAACAAFGEVSLGTHGKRAWWHAHPVALVPGV